MNGHVNVKKVPHCVINVKTTLQIEQCWRQNQLKRISWDVSFCCISYCICDTCGCKVESIVRENLLHMRL